jgi:hypothetical protein
MLKPHFWGAPIHRTVATILEAERCAPAVIVQSFNPRHIGFSNFQAFAAALKLHVERPATLSAAVKCQRNQPSTWLGTRQTDGDGLTTRKHCCGVTVTHTPSHLFLKQHQLGKQSLPRLKFLRHKPKHTASSDGG